MKIIKFEQSGFILEMESGFRVAIDIASMTPLEKLQDVFPVDLFIASHIHGDHFSPDHIAKLAPKTIILSRESYDVVRPSGAHVPVGVPTPMQIQADYILSKNGLVYETKDIKITFFHVDHGPNVSVPVDNFGFLIEADNQKIYFAGDMFYPSGIERADLEVDYALVPVGTHYTFGPQEAVDFAKTFKKIGTLVPMHDRLDVAKTDEFVVLAGPYFNVVKM